MLSSENCRALRVSDFLLCLLSPVWRAKLCGGFSGSTSRRLEMQAEEETAFQQLLRLGVGGKASVRGGLRGLVEVAMIADRYRMEAVLEAVEGELLRRLTVETCAEMLITGAVSGLSRVEGESRRLALREFEPLSRTDGFFRLSEDLLASLLDSDELIAPGEEVVFEAVVRWMRAAGGTGDLRGKSDVGGGEGAGGGGGGLRGEGLLRRVRFPLMDWEYLFETARDTLPEACPALEMMVLEALALKSFPAHRRPGVRLRHLDPAVARPRRAAAGRMSESSGRRQSEAFLRRAIRGARGAGWQHVPRRLGETRIYSGRLGSLVGQVGNMHHVSCRDYYLDRRCGGRRD